MCNAHASCTPSTPPSATARKHHARIALGLCGGCGKRPPAEERTRCEHCLAVRATQKRRRRLRLSQKRLCQGCGNVPPAPGRSRCKPCGEAWARRTADNKRARKASRRAQGLCQTCGDRPPEDGRLSCRPCLDRRARSNPNTAVPFGERRFCWQCGTLITVARRRLCSSCSARPVASLQQRRAAAGLCKICGINTTPRGKVHCQPCLDAIGVRQCATHARHAAAGVCVSCNREPSLSDSRYCAPCRDRLRRNRLALWRIKTNQRRAEGLCIRCGKQPALPDFDTCAGCREQVRAYSLTRYRRRSSERKAAGLCVRCGERPPEHGTLDCGPCRDKQQSYRYRGMPDLPNRYTVIEIATGTDHGTWETLQEVAGALAYAKLTLDDVEIVSDTAPMAAFRSW